jgi:hypothetical protein
MRVMGENTRPIGHVSESNSLSSSCALAAKYSSSFPSQSRPDHKMSGGKMENSIVKSPFTLGIESWIALVSNHPQELHMAPTPVTLVDESDDDSVLTSNIGNFLL